MAEKLTDSEIATIRESAAAGVPRTELAEEFGVSRRHISRIVSGEVRQPLAPLDRLIVEPSVGEAVERFLDGLELDRADEVLAETAKTLAVKLDQARSSVSSASLRRRLLLPASSLRR